MNINIIKNTEKDVEILLETMSPIHKNIMYKILYNSGHRISNVDVELQKAKKYIPLKSTFQIQISRIDNKRRSCVITFE